MYDELVKRLRAAAKEWRKKNKVVGVGETRYDFALDEAANAIWELSFDLDSMQELNIALYAALPRWIPVTERLPDGEAERYLVAAPLMSLGLWVSICYYADNLEEVDEYDFKDKNHSGFYGYDDEYGYYERSGVKYWMPLPEPPKEGDA